MDISLFTWWASPHPSKTNSDVLDIHPISANMESSFCASLYSYFRVSLAHTVISLDTDLFVSSF